MPKKHKDDPKGHWIATTAKPLSETFTDEEELLRFLRRNPGCYVSWKEGKPINEDPE